jgi:hypothetical protein
MEEQKFTIEVVDDPELNTQLRAEGAQFKKNLEWLASHWADVLPQARGKYIAVAGQEPFIADDAIEAEKLAVAKHPEGKGVLVQYVYSSPNVATRTYGYHRRMGS